MKTKICTDIDQSKKLLELGIDPNTADMYWDYQPDGYVLIASELGYYNNDSEIPAWSLSALLDLMQNIDEFYPKIEKDQNDKDTPYGCVYSDGNYDWHFYYANNPIDTAFEMVCFLLRNGYIKK